MNAAGRMATANDVIEMFLTADPSRARALADAVARAECGATEDRSGNYRKRFSQECARARRRFPACAGVLCARTGTAAYSGSSPAGWSNVFTGRCSCSVRTPAAAMAQGSGRSIQRFHLLEALESMPELFVKFGGHSHAAGLTLSSSHVDTFRRQLQDYAGARLTPEDFCGELEIDGVLTLNEINERNVAGILSLAPFGCGHAMPVFAALNVEVAGPPVLWKEKHLRVPFRQNGRMLWMKAWNFAGRIAELPPGARVDAAITVEEDSYAAASGLPGWSVVLRDVRAAKAAATA